MPNNCRELFDDMSLIQPDKIPKYRLRAILAMIVLFAAIIPASGHFLLNLNVRIFHVEHLDDGLRIRVRMPMPYLVAGLVGPVGEDGLPAPAPFTYNRIENGKPAHYADFDAMAADKLGLGLLAADGLQVSSSKTRLNPRVEAVRLYRIGTQPQFATLDEARAAFAGVSDNPNTGAPLYVGDAMVDTVLHFGAGEPVNSYELASTLDPGLPDQDKTANLILDYGAGGTKVFRARGLLAEPVVVSRSSLAAILTFIKEGIRHILEGLDHVLFVICLVIGAASLKILAWRVTGFTIGHSVTLSVGFFGFVPKGAWFVPAIETGIALSIIYAAFVAVRTDFENPRGERSMLLVTGAIGLLHGLGFSFVLKNILQVTSPDIWQSLLAFNVGVEIGQLAIVCAVWPLIWLVGRTRTSSARLLRTGIAAFCAVIAIYWTGERLLGLVALI